MTENFFNAHTVYSADGNKSLAQALHPTNLCTVIAQEWQKSVRRGHWVGWAFSCLKRAPPGRLTLGTGPEGLEWSCNREG